MQKMQETLGKVMEDQNLPPQGPMEMLAAYKSLKPAHDCSKSFKVKMLLNLYAFLYLPRHYHRAFETVRKNAFDCLKEFGAKPEQLGFELIPG